MVYAELLWQRNTRRSVGKRWSTYGNNLLLSIPKNTAYNKIINEYNLFVNQSNFTAMFKNDFLKTICVYITLK